MVCGIINQTKICHHLNSHDEPTIVNARDNGQNANECLFLQHHTHWIFTAPCKQRPRVICQRAQVVLGGSYATESGALWRALNTQSAANPISRSTAPLAMSVKSRGLRCTFNGKNAAMIAVGAKLNSSSLLMIFHSRALDSWSVDALGSPMLLYSLRVLHIHIFLFYLVQESCGGIPLALSERAAKSTYIWPHPICVLWGGAWRGVGAV